MEKNSSLLGTPPSSSYKYPQDLGHVPRSLLSLTVQETSLPGLGKELCFCFADMSTHPEVTIFFIKRDSRLRFLLVSVHCSQCPVIYSN